MGQAGNKQGGRLRPEVSGRCKCDQHPVRRQRGSDGMKSKAPFPGASEKHISCKDTNNLKGKRMEKVYLAYISHKEARVAELISGWISEQRILPRIKKAISK